MHTPLNIELTVEQVRIIMDAVSQLPWRDVNALIAAVDKQVREQLSAQQGAPDASETE